MEFEKQIRKNMKLIEKEENNKWYKKYGGRRLLEDIFKFINKHHRCPICKGYANVIPSSFFGNYELGFCIDCNLIIYVIYANEYCGNGWTYWLPQDYYLVRDSDVKCINVGFKRRLSRKSKDKIIKKISNK